MDVVAKARPSLFVQQERRARPRTSSKEKTLGRASVSRSLPPRGAPTLGAPPRSAVERVTALIRVGVGFGRVTASYGAGEGRAERPSTSSRTGGEEGVRSESLPEVRVEGSE